VVEGEFIPGISVIAEVDIVRRQDIMRNHTATHLLHAELREILGEHVRQAGSLVAPDRLRFDFTHPKAMSREEIKKVEDAVNLRVLNNYILNVREKNLSQALEEGAMALFGEKYGEEVRTITIGDEMPFSYELCGGTHVNETAEIGTFIITSEGSAAAGIRRIEAITGRKAYELIRRREKTLEEINDTLEISSDELVSAIKKLVFIKEEYEKQYKLISSKSAMSSYKDAKDSLKDIQGRKVMWLKLENSSPDILRNLADQFRKDFPSGIAIFVNITNGNVQIVSAVTEDLVKEKVSAGEIVKKISKALGGSGGGRPELAQGGGKDSGMLPEIEINLSEYL
jgi:alanyl-tRNA synthetase